MKQFNLRFTLFALLFAAVTGFLSVNVLAGSDIEPVKRISWNMPDSSGDTTDGGIRNPGNGH